ncbi:MAG: uroporphyrinogen-III C-methyltransferase, partial [Peptococcaceae bacterium]|nr:uroporphyrinogen-III C-methyltransferase [Peptococcaceae bacterium]
MVNKGMVYLVGAGPGDPGLITLKGKECLEKSEVIIYDRLAGEGILRWAPDTAELIYVGKTPENHTLKQDEINQLILRKAREGKIVTRLKGGDPFVFGRGGEEGQILFESGIPFEVVPGITSAIAVPAYAGIPVTHRGVSSSFEVITGNEDPEKNDSQIDWTRLASSKGTLVFLMGMANLPKISGQLINQGMEETTPVAVIQWGTTSQQKTVTGVLKNIQQRVVEEGLA